MNFQQLGRNTVLLVRSRLLHRNAEHGSSTRATHDLALSDAISRRDLKGIEGTKQAYVRISVCSSGGRVFRYGFWTSPWDSYDANGTVRSNTAGN